MVEVLDRYYLDPKSRGRSAPPARGLAGNGQRLGNGQNDPQQLDQHTGTSRQGAKAWTEPNWGPEIAGTPKARFCAV